VRNVRTLNTVDGNQGKRQHRMGRFGQHVLSLHRRYKKLPERSHPRFSISASASPAAEQWVMTEAIALRAEHTFVVVDSQTTAARSETGHTNTEQKTAAVGVGAATRGVDFAPPRLVVLQGISREATARLCQRPGGARVAYRATASRAIAMRGARNDSPRSRGGIATARTRAH
jgi:hypothetical protein